MTALPLRLGQQNIVGRECAAGGSVASTVGGGLLPHRLLPSKLFQRRQIGRQGVARLADSFLRRFVLIEEAPRILDTWLDLVWRYQVSGKVVHDARLVALMVVQGVPNILTFNFKDFVRYAEIQAAHPLSLLNPKNP